jgi:hypothetical protein
LQCSRASLRAAESAQLSLRVLIRNCSCLEEVGLQLQIMCLNSVGCDRGDALIKEHPKRLVFGQLGELFELDALRISQPFGLVNEIKVCVTFERKNVGLDTLRQVARNTVDGDSGVRVVIGLDPGTVRLGIVHFGLIESG